MDIKIDPDWWKTLFDEVYLITDARSVCDEALTCHEIDMICDLLPIKPDHKILDLCGGHGRHTFELCKRGFIHCTVLDYSQALLEMAAIKAREENYPIQLARSDARQTGFPPAVFDHVLILGNSLGYIHDFEADRHIVLEAQRVLRPNGWLLVDVTDGLAVKQSFVPNAWHEIGEDTVICRQRELLGNSVAAREMVLNKQSGLIRDRSYAIRLYDSASLDRLLQQAGLDRIKVYTQFSPHHCTADVGFMKNRMIAVGQKR